MLFCVVAVQAATYNYAEVLQKATIFYEIQRSGKVPSSNRVLWRGDSALNDGKDNNVDLTGGWHDAGDNVKFGFPMAGTTTVLAWAYIEYPDAFTKSGQATYHLNNLRWACDYFIKAHTAPTEFYGQVGNGDADHAWWGPAECLDAHFTPKTRPSYKITAQCPGSDLAGETAAALAASSIVFSATDKTYAATLLTHAKQLYDFAENYLGVYTNCITDAKNFYNSWSGYNDELVWGAAWLYKATNDPQYLQKANKYYPLIAHRVTWTHSWDDKSYGAYVLLSKLTHGNYNYVNDSNNYLDWWTVGFNGKKVNYTPGGLAWLDNWGVLRYSATTAFVAFVYADWTNDTARAQAYRQFATNQINYMLGDNPLKRSYIGGFGNNPPIEEHHRTGHSSWTDNLQNPINNRHILYGALVGGPNQQDAYEDSRQNYQQNEPACDYNAGFIGAVARLYQQYGGTPLSNFPAPETKGLEFQVEASINSQAASYTEIRALIENMSGWPSRATSDLSLRYYLNLTHIISAGYKPSDVVLTLGYNQGATLSTLQTWDAAHNIYYVEVSFQGVVIYPGGQSAFYKEVQFRMALPQNQNNWDPTNDWSYQGLKSGQPAPTQFIPIYEQGAILAGKQPPK